MGLMINPAPTFTLNNGDIASEGKLHFFENGSTSIRKPVYIDPELNSQLNNPLTLTDAGRLPTCFGTGTYTIVLESADLVQQWVRNDVAIDDLSGQFSDYSSVKIYLTNEIVRYTDGNYYFSLKNNNRGNSPSSNSEWWSQIGFLEFFNSSKADDNAYKLNDIVISGGFLYRSLENDNGDTPPSAKWANLTFNDSVTGNFSVGGDLTVTGDIIGDNSITGSLSVAGDAEVVGDLIIGGTHYNDQGEISVDGGSTFFPLITGDDSSYVEFTTEDWISFGYASCLKVGNLVIVNLDIVTGTSSVGSVLLEGAIPSGHIPPAFMRKNIWIMDYQNQVGYSARVETVVGTGDLLLTRSSTVSASARGTLTFCYTV